MVSLVLAVGIGASVLPLLRRALPILLDAVPVSALSLSPLGCIYGAMLLLLSAFCTRHTVSMSLSAVVLMPILLCRRLLA